MGRRLASWPTNRQTPGAGALADSGHSGLTSLPPRKALLRMVFTQVAAGTMLADPIAVCADWNPTGLLSCPPRSRCEHVNMPHRRPKIWPRRSGTCSWCAGNMSRRPRCRHPAAAVGGGIQPTDVTLNNENIHRRLLRARDTMDRSYSQPLDVAALARIAFMSQAHFIREFNRVFGEPPYRYLQRRRVERAMFLLQHGGDSVTDICMTVGFASLGTFSRTFTAIVGESPTGYRVRTRGLPQRAPTSFAMRWNRPSSFGEAQSAHRK